MADEIKDETPQTAPEGTEQKSDRPDRSQLNAFENFYENFSKVPLKYIDAFIPRSFTASGVFLFAYNKSGREVRITLRSLPLYLQQNYFLIGFFFLRTL